MAKMVPVTKMITDGAIKLNPLPKTKAESGTPRAPSP